MLKKLSRLSLAVAGLTASTVFLGTPAAQAQGSPLDPIDERAFADVVVDYYNGSYENFKDLVESHQPFDSAAALGRNTWDKTQTKKGPGKEWDRSVGVSLGYEGYITLEFTDNYLTGNNSEASDLWLFEIGARPEEAYVSISSDGEKWFDVGLAQRTDRKNDNGVGIDIDALLNTNDELDSTSRFKYVKITDAVVGDEAYAGNGYRNRKAGFDIDAVAALSFVPQDKEPVDIPEPGVIGGLVVLGVGLLRRRLG